MDSVDKILAELRNKGVPKEALVLVTGGPPCVDHSRVKGAAAKLEAGREGAKLLQFASFVMDLVQGLPWPVVLLLEHVVPRAIEPVREVSRVLGVEPFLGDSADLGLVRRPRLWLSNCL